MKPRPLTRKQKAFVEHLVNHPKDSATKAIQATYNIDNPRTASVVAAQNLTKPSIVTELNKYNNLVEDTLINTVSEWGSHEKPRQREIALDTAKFIHDKIHGRATQRVEAHSTSVNLVIDLTGTHTQLED